MPLGGSPDLRVAGELVRDDNEIVVRACRRTNMTSVHVPAALKRPSCASSHAPSKAEGAGNAGCWPQPMARLQQKKQAAVTTGPAGSSGTPCAMGYVLYVISPVSMTS